MADCGLSMLEVRFALGDGESTELLIARDQDAGYVGRSTYYRQGGPFFPGNETKERKGLVGTSSASTYEHTILSKCQGSWRHRYGSVRYDSPEDAVGSWKIKLTYADGTVLRWMGIRESPAEIDALYQIFVDYGMLPLELGYWGSLHRLMGGESKTEVLEQLGSYLRDLSELIGAERMVGIEKPEVTGLAHELCDDIVVLTAGDLRAQLDALLLTWAPDRTPEGLCGVEVSKASRLQMLALLLELARQPDVPGVLRMLYDTDTLSRWEYRLRRIPSDEERARSMQLEEERRRRDQRMEDDVMSRIASGTTITSRDVARATNTSPRQASSVIRRLVRRGLISGVAGTNPRQYVAITDVQASDAPQESALEEKTVA